MPKTKSNSHNIEQSNENVNAAQSNSAIGGPNEKSSKIYSLHDVQGKKEYKEFDHCHKGRRIAVDALARRKIIIASLLCVFFMICEVVGGLLSNSLAIATDAAHLLTDFAAFMILLLTIWLATKPSSETYSFGWHRAEVMGAIASVMLTWIITSILILLAIQRLISLDFVIDSRIMLISSVFAFVVNLIMAFQLHHGHSHNAEVIVCDDIVMDNKDDLSDVNFKPMNAVDSCILRDDVAERLLMQMEAAEHSSDHKSVSNERIEPDENQIEDNNLNENEASTSAKNEQKKASLDPNCVIRKEEQKNINLRAAFLHVLGDMVHSVGVFVAALFIYFQPDWIIIDPICTFVFSIIVMCTTFNIMKDTLLVLMEGTPRHLRYNEVLNVLQNVNGVERVHNLRIWALNMRQSALSTHLTIKTGADPKQVLQEATRTVRQRYSFYETTIQIEEYSPPIDDCEECMVESN